CKGDLLFLYTDGVTQARGRDKAYFSERLSDELGALAGRHPDQVVSSMRSALLEFSGHELMDDYSMVVLRVGDGPDSGRPSARAAGGRGAASSAGRASSSASRRRPRSSDRARAS